MSYVLSEEDWPRIFALSGRVVPYVRAILWVLFGISALLLLVRTLHGELIGPPLKIRSPLNAESFVAVSFLLLVLLRARGGQPTPLIHSAPINAERQSALILVMLLVLCAAAFYHSLGKPLLYDDYGHVMFASQASWREILAAFYRPHPDIFFRPIGFLSYFIDFRWAHFDPFRWHTWSLAIHGLNCALVYILARRLEFVPLSSAMAAAVFAIHGTRAEPVCWTDARFDLLSTLFVLLALISLEQYARKTGKRWLAGSYLFTVLAICTKEAAFALPLMLIAMSLFHRGELRRRLLRVSPGIFALATAVFIYRLWMIQGIGGYQTNGHANVFVFSAIRSVKGLLWRIWALGFFPINWSSQPSVTVAVLMAAFLVLLAAIAAGGRLNKIRLFGALLLVLAASLPVEHLLLIGSDLAGARILYLPMLGIALFWAVVLEAYMARKYLSYGIAAVALGFNLACLEGNITIWTQVAEAARSACQTFGRQIANVAGPVRVAGVPTKYRGVYFLANGFAECVQINSGVPASRIVTAGGRTTPSRTYRWNEPARRFEEAESTVH